MFNAIDFKDCSILYKETSDEKKEDLLQLRCRNGRFIDVGWYGAENKYCILVVENEDWEHPCYKIDHQPQLGYVEHHLQKIIEYETASFDPSAKALLSQITNAIDNWQEWNGVFDDIVELLKQLRDMGLTQKEVSNYIEIDALKYNDGNDIRWDMACDILDRITGFCVPELHIWR